MASEYTKHYYIEGQRIASKIGAGLNPSSVLYNSVITPLHGSSYNTISDSLLIMCHRADECAGFNSNNTNYGTKFKCVEPLSSQDNNEPDLYFYHSDHIGSLSFITDAGGKASQHLQYLPFGELFVEQRSTANYYTPYKFSGKEKDEETSYSYFGARYYMSDVSVWLSVDPMKEKYPYQSPYTYCGWNPIKIIDPDGMDEWEADKATGNMINTKTTDNDVIYQTVDGKRTGEKQEFTGKVIDRKTDINTNRKIEGKDQPVTLTDLFFKTKESSDLAFNFLSDYTDVEWSKINADNIGIPDKPNNSIHTSHKNAIEFRGAEMSTSMLPEDWNINSFSHSHPEDDYNDYTSSPDRKHKNDLRKNFPDCNFTLRYSGKERSYKKDNAFRHYEVGREHKSKLF